MNSFYLNENVENRKENVIIGSELLIYEHPHIYYTKLQKSSDDYRERVVVKLPYGENSILSSVYKLCIYLLEDKV